MRARHHLQTAIGGIDLFEGHPGGDAGPRLRSQVVLILVQRLSARARGLEIRHRLDGVRLATRNRSQAPAQALVEQPLLADLIPTVHVE